MAALFAFADELRRPCGDSDSARPFVCGGSPLDCEIFLVGANPATDVPFWPFSSDATGFDYSRWRLADEHARLNRGRRAISNTRQRIDRFVEGASPIKVLETNAFATPTRSIRELAPGERSTSALAFLLGAIRPKVVVLHGSDAGRAFDEAARATRSLAHVIRVRHLRLQSYEFALDLGREARDLITGR